MIPITCAFSDCSEHATHALSTTNGAHVDACDIHATIVDGPVFVMVSVAR